MPDLLLFGRFGRGILGEEATLAALLQELPNRLPEARLVVVSADPARTAAEHGVAAQLDDLPELAAAVRRSRLVAVCGTEILHSAPASRFSDPPTSRSTPILSAVALAVALGRPLGICAASFAHVPADGSDLDGIAAFDFATTSSVRDRRSLDLAAGMGLADSRLPALAADPAYLLTPAADAAVHSLLAELRLAPGEPLVVVSPRIPGPEVDAAGWDVALIEALNTYQRSHSGTLLFLPWQIEAAVPGENDLSVSARLATAVEQPDRARLLQRALPPDLVAAILERCEVVVAMREHTAILALRAGVPVVGLAEDPGLDVLLSEADLDGFSLPPGDWTAAAMASALEAAPGLRENARLQALACAQRARARIGIERLVAAWDVPGRFRAGETWFAERLLVCQGVNDAMDSTARSRGAASRSAEAWVPRPCGDHSVDSLPRFAEAAGARGASWLTLLLPSRTHNPIIELPRLTEALRGFGAAVIRATDPGESVGQPEPDETVLAIDLTGILAAPDTLAFVGSFALRTAVVSSPTNSEFELVATLAGVGWKIVYLIPEEYAADPTGVDTELARHLLATADLAVVWDSAGEELVRKRRPEGDVLVSDRARLAVNLFDWVTSSVRDGGLVPGGPA